MSKTYCVLYFNVFILKGSLNENYDDEVAGIKFAILFDDLADHFPEEKFKKLEDLIQSNVSRIDCCYIFFCAKNLLLKFLCCLF